MVIEEAESLMSAIMVATEGERDMAGVPGSLSKLTLEPVDDMLPCRAANASW